MTVRTRADLLALYTDNTSGDISFQDGRDVIDTFDALAIQCINVKDAPYLCAGDGSTDDTTNFQSALDAAATAALPVYVPPGTYMVDSLTLDQDRNQGLFGWPGLRCIIQQRSGQVAGTALLSTDNANGQAGPKIKDLSLIGHTSGGSVLKIQNCNHGHYENLQITNGGAGNYAQIEITAGTCSEHTFRNVRLHFTSNSDTNYGVWAHTGTASNIRFYDLDASGLGVADRAWEDGHCVYLNGSGIDGFHFHRGKLNGVWCTAGAIRIVDGSGHSFNNFGTEFHASAGTGTDDFIFDNASRCHVEFVTLGDDKVTNSLTLLNGCEDIKFDHCYFDQNIVFSATGDDEIKISDSTIEETATISNYSWPEHSVDLRTVDTSQNLTGGHPTGTATILGGNTTVTGISHNFPVTPEKAQFVLTPLEDSTNDPGTIRINGNPTSSAFQIGCENAPGSDLDIAWRVIP